MSDINTKIDELTAALDTSLDTLESKIGRKLSAPLGGENGMVVAKDSTSLTGTKYIAPAEVISENPLCFTATANNQELKFWGTPVEPTVLEYSRDGITWEIFNAGQDYTLTNAGDKIYLRGDNTSMNGLYLANTNANVSGNIMSLLDKSCRLRKITKNKCFYLLFSNCSNLTFDGLELPADEVSADEAYYWLFRGCTGLTSINLPATKVSGRCYREICEGCTGLKKARVGFKTLNGQNLYEAFKGCSGLEELEVHFESWGERDALFDWVANASTTLKFICPPALDTTIVDNSHVLSGWTIIHGSNEPSDALVHDVQPTAVETFMVRSGDDVPVISVASTLTLYAETMSADSIAYAEVVLDIASGATVTAGSNLTLVDEPTDGMRNICVVRWQDGAAKLYVTMTEELEESPSSAGE